MTIQLVALNHCPLCLNKKNLRLFYELEKFGVFECRCGMVFIDPSLDAQSMMEIYQSSETLKEINPALDQYYEYKTLNPKSDTYREYCHALREAAAQVKGRDLLEVGCGTGQFLKLAQDQGWRVAGLDSSSENIAKVEEKGIKGFCCNFLDYRDPEKFDCLILGDLIEHPQNPGDFVKKSWDLLNAGGILLIATPNYPNFLSVLAGVIYRITRGAIRSPVEKLYMLEHTTYFGIKTLRALLEDRGFTIVKSWKSETDLARYSFPFVLRVALSITFVISRTFGWQNRINAIARKVDGSP